MTVGTFGTFTPEVKENPYTATMVEFVKASEADPTTDWTVEIDAKRESAERLLIAEAANAEGKTARLRKRDDSQRVQAGTRAKSGNPVYEGIVKLTFTLAPKHAARRGKDEAGDDVVADEVKATKGK